MSKPKMQHCFNCGKELGAYVAYYGDIQSCGERECEKAANDMHRELQEDRAERAREDDYERY